MGEINAFIRFGKGEGNSPVGVVIAVAVGGAAAIVTGTVVVTLHAMGC